MLIIAWFSFHPHNPKLFVYDAITKIILQKPNLFPIGTASVLTVSILGIPQLDLEDVGDALEWVFLCIFPNYCFFTSLETLYRNHQALKVTFSVHDNTQLISDTIMAFVFRSF